MLALARLAFDLALPTEDAGTTAFTKPDRDERWVRRLFEKAVAGFFAVELVPLGWRVRAGEVLRWPVVHQSQGIASILPTMRTDVVLDPPDGHRIVIDTKFMAILRPGWYREWSLNPSHLFQLYAYLRSQEEDSEADPSWKRASGLLLYPSTGQVVDEFAEIQGHHLRFLTVDLTQPPSQIRSALRSAIPGSGSRQLVSVRRDRQLLAGPGGSMRPTTAGDA